MRMVRYNSSSALRFKRWSRASYAVFCSVGRMVTIGKVAVGIEEASMVSLPDENQDEIIIVKGQYLLGYAFMRNMESEGSLRASRN